MKAHLTATIAVLLGIAGAYSMLGLPQASETRPSAISPQRQAAILAFAKAREAQASIQAKALFQQAKPDGVIAEQVARAPSASK
jgi:hypothetical protein